MLDRRFIDVDLTAARLAQDARRQSRLKLPIDRPVSLVAGPPGAGRTAAIALEANPTLRTRPAGPLTTPRARGLVGSDDAVEARVGVHGGAPRGRRARGDERRSPRARPRRAGRRPRRLRCLSFRASLGDRDRQGPRALRAESRRARGFFRPPAGRTGRGPRHPAHARPARLTPFSFFRDSHVPHDTPCPGAVSDGAHVAPIVALTPPFDRAGRQVAPIAGGDRRPSARAGQLADGFRPLVRNRRGRRGVVRGQPATGRCGAGAPRPWGRDGGRRRLRERGSARCAFDAEPARPAVET